MKNIYILDACALLAAYRRETGYDVIAGLYEDAVTGKIDLCMNIVNLQTKMNSISPFYG